MTNKKIRYQPIDPFITTVVEKHASQPEALVEILVDVQEQRGGLTDAMITDIARSLGMPAEKAFGVASFYSMLSLKPRPGNIMRVCDGPVCWLRGAQGVRHAFESQAYGQPDWTVERTSCLGLCDRAPAVLVNDEQAGAIEPEHVARVYQGWRGNAHDYAQARPGEVRVMMAKAGLIDPDALESALQHGAYQGLMQALSLSPAAVIDEVEAAGLTGRGGAGFSVGRKWRFVAREDRKPKYIVCNADESEPLIYKDRVLIDTNPHQILEGMAIAGYATEAEEAYIYIRGEYKYQAQRLETAIQQAEAAGWLGENVQGSSFSFHIHVHRGAGAYICGEETALIESLEGKRGEPRNRPPYPPAYGYHGMPTLVNNVESFAAVPGIIVNGKDWYRSLSAAATPGTKIYMVTGHVNHPGLFEAPFGLTLRQVIEDFGGGMRPGSEFQFALTGGAAGTLVSPALLDVPIDYGSASKGVSLGAGAFLICDQTVPVVDFLRELLHFFRVESCGKCTPCRVGTYRAFEVLDRMSQGLGTPGDIGELHELADVMHDASFCGLGQSVAIPIHSALLHFNADFARINSK